MDLQQSYMKNAAILTTTGLFLRAVGMLFRIYVAGRIGAEGMGLYQLIYSVYSMAITLATGGLTICTTCVVTDTLSSGKGTARAMQRILTLGIVLGISSGIILFLSSDILSIYILADKRAALSLRILAPSLPFMALSAALRGYFIAKRCVSPNVRAQIAEQMIRIALVASIFYFYAPTNTQNACAAVLLGNTVSEACSWIYMNFCYNRDIALTHESSHLYTSPRLLHILLPISANMYLTSFLRAIENVIVPACLTEYTLQRDIALAEYGALKGMAMPVIFFPFSLLISLSTLLMPEITEAFVRRKPKKLEYLVRRVLKITCILSILAGCLFTLFSQEIAFVLYKDNAIGFYLRVLGPIMPIMYLESIVDGILKGMDEQIATFKYSIVDSILRIVLIILLLPKFGMKGFLFIMLVSNLFTGALNIQRLLKVTQIKFDWKQWTVKPLVACIAVGVALKYAARPLLFMCLPLSAWIIISGLASCCIYFVVLWLLGGFEITELLQINRKKL
ncbi:MAG: polysaccharide biosynthesis C-terminal domain-containing protein [Oscillospiraceae bacterium]